MWRSSVFAECGGRVCDFSALFAEFCLLNVAAVCNVSAPRGARMRCQNADMVAVELGIEPGIALYGIIDSAGPETGAPSSSYAESWLSSLLPNQLWRCCHGSSYRCPFRSVRSTLAKSYYLASNEFLLLQAPQERPNCLRSFRSNSSLTSKIVKPELTDTARKWRTSRPEILPASFLAAQTFIC